MKNEGSEAIYGLGITPGLGYITGPEGKRAQEEALRKDRSPARRIVVSLVGRERQGKTSLRRLLAGEPFNRDEPSTVGIERELVDTQALEPGSSSWGDWRSVKIETANQHEFVEVLGRHIHTRLENVRHRIPLARRAINSFLTMFKIGTINYCTTPFFLWAASVESLSVWPLYGLTILVMFVICGITFGRRDGFGIAVGLCHLVVLIESLLRWRMDEWFEENVDKYGTLRTFLMGAAWYGAMEAAEATFLGMSLGLGMQCVFFVSSPPYTNYFRDGNPLLKPDIHVLVVGCLFGLACVKNKYSQKMIPPVVAVALAILPVFLSFVFVCGTSVGVLHGIFLFVGQSTFPVLNRAIKTVTSQPLGRHMIRHCVGILPGVFVTWLFGWALVTSPVGVSVAHVITAAVLVALNECECLLQGTLLLSQSCRDVLKNALSQHFEAPPKSATERQPSQDREYSQARRDSVRRDSLDRRDSPGRRDSPDRKDLPDGRDSPDRRHLPFRRRQLDGRNSPDRRHSPDRKPVQDKRVEALSSHRPRSGSIGIDQPSSVLHTALTPTTPRIVVRDFAGHPLYYSAHHVYMAGQCIYILVFSMLEASRNFEDVLRNLIDWLQSIYLHTGFPDTRVFIVGTHRDHPDLKVSSGEDAVISVGHRLRRDIPRHFHNMLVWTDKDMPLFPVENSLRDKHDKDHRYLRHRLLQTVEELNTDKYPVRYFFFFHVLEDRRKLEVLMDSTESLYEECQSNQCAIRDRDDFDAMLLLFKRLGEVLYFPHDNLLQSVVVLSPHAVLGLLSHLLDVPKMADRARDYVADWDRLERTGVCTRRLFEHVLHLHAQNLSDESDTVLYLLKTLNLICPLGMEGGGGEAEQGYDGGVSLGGGSSVSDSGRNVTTVMHQESMRLESVTHGRVTHRMIPPNIKPPRMMPPGRMTHESTTTRERIPQESSIHEDISRIEMRGESIRSEHSEHGGIILGGDTSQYLVERGVRTQDFVSRQDFTGRSSNGTDQSIGDISSNGQRHTGCLCRSVRPLSVSMKVTGSVSQRDSGFVSSFAPDRGDDDHDDDSDEDNNSYQGGDGSRGSRGTRRQPVEHEEHSSLDLHNTEHFNQAASRVRSGSIEITDVEMYLVPAGLPQNLLHEHQYWDTRRGDWELLIDGLPLLPHAAFLRLLCVCAAQDLCDAQDEMGSHELTACQSRAAFTFGTSRCYKLEWLKTSDVASTYHGRLLKLVIAGDEKPNTMPGSFTPQERENVRSAAVTPQTLAEFVWRSMTEIVRRDFNRCHLRLGVRCPCSSPHQNLRAEDEFHLLVVCDTRHGTRQDLVIPQSKDFWCCGRHVRYERGKVYEVPGGRGQQVTGVIHPDLPILELCIGDMPHALHAQVCDLLDIPHALGNDWTALAGHLGKTVREVELLRVRAPRDPCDALLQDWARRAPECTVRDLIRVMRRMKRMDVIKTIEDFSL